MKVKWIGLLIICCLACSSRESGTVMDLSGTWSVQLDSLGQGIEQEWYKDLFDRQIKLPGSLRENDLGFSPTVNSRWTGSVVDSSWYTDLRYKPYRQSGSVKIPFWLTPVKHYVGCAWYQRNIDIPAEWSGKQIRLFLERCHWQSTAWIDSIALGTQTSLSTPHEYTLPQNLSPGRHRLTLLVDNRVKIRVGQNAHSISDHTQTNWNGITGKMQLRAFDWVTVESVQVFPDLKKRNCSVEIVLLNQRGRFENVDIVCKAQSQSDNCAEKPIRHSLELMPGEQSIRLDYPFTESWNLWDEFKPHLYALTVELHGENDIIDVHQIEFGLRSISTKDTHFYLNDRPVFLRGTLECCIFPLTGYPPTTIDSWSHIMTVIKNYGLNHIRFHSWCPPKAAFKAADRAGIMLQVECAAWVNQGDVLGSGYPVDRFVQQESERIVREYGNHPSFCLMAYGNEPAGADKDRFLVDFVQEWKEKDPRRLYTGAAGWPILPVNQFHSSPEPRIQQWGQGLDSRVNRAAHETQTDYSGYVSQYEVPVISHEIGQWCVYPNLQEIEKYTGDLKAKNFEIYRDFLQNNHMLDQAHDFLMASGKLQALLYKEEIEASLRTPGLGGFQLLDLHDFPGQGTALVGVLDAFWDEKGYISAQEFRKFCNSTVPLMRTNKVVYTSEQEFVSDIELYHYGETDLKNVAITATLQGDSLITEKIFHKERVQRGQLTAIGQMRYSWHQVTAPAKYTLFISVSGTEFQNQWDLWVFPKDDHHDQKEVTVVQTVSDTVLQNLRHGDKVLWLVHPDSISNTIALGFSPIFWNTAWTRHQAPHTLGLLMDPEHDLFVHFPTEFHSNWHWWELIHSRKALCLDGLNPDLRPVIQVIDDWNTAHRLGLLLEARVGAGKIMITSMDLENVETRPVAKQMRTAVFNYMHSDVFNPAIHLDRNELLKLLH